ncbi:hypothetical protein Rhe02_11250 [Rhizocola hellebori]|uniref:Uncharacterized protein n=1 Tax=Rhizocola hellebori TaxID=1392758 RepID=A0A8J3VEJ0_9ACTN|nr:hypothetical protein Rhe02_11250 [Rhizocola hellebori]
MSPDIELFIVLTAACAPESEHGWAAVQVEPVPVGEAKRVVVAAEASGIWIISAAAVANAVALNPASLRRAEGDRDMGAPQ